jgi:RNA polymerase sigma-70 factor (ECF subfamily)
VALDYLRSVKVEVELVEDPPDRSKPDAVEQSEMRDAIARAVRRLSPRLRAAVLLALVEEQPYEDIAQALGISVNAVKVRVFRGVRILRKELEKTGVHA